MRTPFFNTKPCVLPLASSNSPAIAFGLFALTAVRVDPATSYVVKLYPNGLAATRIVPSGGNVCESVQRTSSAPAAGCRTGDGATEWNFPRIPWS